MFADHHQFVPLMQELCPVGLRCLQHLQESPGMAAALRLLPLAHLCGAKADAAALALSWARTSLWAAGMLPSV